MTTQRTITKEVKSARSAEMIWLRLYEATCMLYRSEKNIRTAEEVEEVVDKLYQKISNLKENEN